MQTIILVSGNPCSGKSTTVKSLHEYITNHGHTATMFLRDYRANNDMLTQNLCLSVYKWMNEKETEFLIIDSHMYTVFDRMDLMDTINRMTQGESENDVYVVSINIDRNNSFLIDINSTNGHVPYKKPMMQKLMHLYQQPVSSEGFDLCYYLSGKKYLDPSHMFEQLAKHLDSRFDELVDVTEEVAAETAEPEEEPVNLIPGVEMEQIQ